MKKAFILLMLCISSLSAFSQSSFLELCKTGTPAQIETAIKDGASISMRWRICLYAPHDGGKGQS